MKTVSIRELHAKTGEVVRGVARHGQILVTDNGRPVAKILPEAPRAEVSYFARRRFISEAVKKRIEGGRLGRGGTDSTVGISEDRDDRD